MEASQRGSVVLTVISEANANWIWAACLRKSTRRGLPTLKQLISPTYRWDKRGDGIDQTILSRLMRKGCTDSTCNGSTSVSL